MPLLCSFCPAPAVPGAPQSLPNGDDPVAACAPCKALWDAHGRTETPTVPDQVTRAYIAALEQSIAFDNHRDAL